MEEMKKMLEESKIKTETIKTLSENVNSITNAYWIISENNESDTDKLDIYEQRTTSDDFRKPRRTFEMLNSENKTVTEPIKLSKNPFDLLKHMASNTIYFDIVDDSNTTNKNPFIISESDKSEIRNHVKTQNNYRKIPSVVINHFPENQSVFRKKRTVPGENSLVKQ